MRWLDLLPRATIAEAWELIRQDAAYSDLTQTQYASSLAWLFRIGLADKKGTSLPLVSDQRAELLFRASLAADNAPWLEDADVQIGAVDDLPSDALTLAGALGLSDEQALIGIRQVHGALDLARRNEVGALGERLLMERLETCWPGCARRVSLEDDSLGYDIELVTGGEEWKLEVKSTTRRNRLRVFVSRNELLVGSMSPHWRLVVVGIDSREEEVEAIATALTPYIEGVAPQNTSSTSRWESASFDLGSDALVPGLRFLQLGNAPDSEQIFHTGRSCDERTFSWMPAA